MTFERLGITLTTLIPKIFKKPRETPSKYLWPYVMRIYACQLMYQRTYFINAQRMKEHRGFLRRET